MCKETEISLHTLFVHCRPFGENDYPYLVGGKWKYTGNDTAKVYDSAVNGILRLGENAEIKLSVDETGTQEYNYKNSALIR